VSFARQITRYFPGGRSFFEIESLCTPLGLLRLTRNASSVIGSSGPRLVRSRGPSVPAMSCLDFPPLTGKRASGRIHHVTSSTCVAGFITSTVISSGSSPTLCGSRTICGCGSGVTDSIGSTIE
jgi:hypothetical protein